MADLTLRRKAAVEVLPLNDDPVIVELYNGHLRVGSFKGRAEGWDIVGRSDDADDVHNFLHVVAWYPIPATLLEIPKVEAPAKPARKLSAVQQYIKAACEAWNMHRRKTWPEVDVKVPGSRVIGYLQLVVRNMHGSYDEALVCVTEGIKFMARDEFYADKVFTFAQAAAKEKLEDNYAKSKLAKKQRQERAASPLHVIGVSVLYQGSISAVVAGWENDRVAIKLPDGTITMVPEYTLRLVGVEA